jgi:hypothetical protein
VPYPAVRIGCPPVLRRECSTRWLAVLALAACGCFQPVEDRDWGQDNNPINGEATDSGSPLDSGMPESAPPTDSGISTDSGTPTDAGTSADAGAADAGLCDPNVQSCLNVGCGQNQPDGGESLPGGYCAPCQGPCDCSIGPGGAAGVCINTGTGNWCSWGCGSSYPAAWCEGQARCFEIVPGDETSSVCVPSSANGSCE